ncbi:MAG TPA: ferredoxin--NADP reductase [Burkholderiales bacterium]|nr:ferredoxin--NADP reductase [Burkholderiales bacterium]
MTKWHEGRVIENRRWTDALFSLRVEAPRLKFEAGQFVRIAVDERVARPFSFVNPPEDPVLEFYGIVVPEGPLSPRLMELRAGDRLLVAPNPAGFLVMSEVPDADTLWLVSTGTGIAPFLSILRTEAPWKRFRNVVLVHAVRHARELVYRELIGQIQREHENVFRDVTFVSREAAPGSLAGRIPAAIRDGRLETAAGLPLNEGSHLMLCGNPDMLKDASGALAERGLRKHRRRTPGHISVESFW